MSHVARNLLSALAVTLLSVAPLSADPQDDDVTDRVHQIVAEHFQIPEDQISNDVSLAKDLGADELDLVELVMAFDAAFGTVTPDATIDDLKTVGDAVRIVSEGGD